jgi:cyclopropane fatty-acyl-phospholipid synthase-like methyltransferase
MQSFYYVNSGGPELAKMLSALSIDRGDIIVDIGSGKGGAAITMARFAFASVVGVEISQQLVAIAQANVAKLKLGNRVHFICSDASQFTDLDQFSYVYMFNPFPCSVMSGFLQNIAASLTRRPRLLRLIYAHPICHDLIVETQLFHLVKTFPFHNAAGYSFHIFEHDK